jgi:hypothetical protein
MINLKDESICSKYIKPIGILISAPLIIALVILIDFITLPKLVWKNEELFEEKYQKNIEELSD